MTVIERWNEIEREAIVFQVNGCFRTEVQPKDVYARSAHYGISVMWRELLAERIPPMIWAAMPCHDDFAPSPTEEGRNE